MEFIHQVEPYLTDNEINAVSKYLKSGGWLTEFKKTQIFGEMVAGHVGSEYAIVVTSGTAALYLSLLACGVGPGDKVIVPNYTMIATINAIKWAGAEPVLVDVDASNLCINVDEIQISESCKAMIYVPINGRSNDMKNVKKFCRKKNLFLIEDAAQAFTSMSGDRYLGTFGDIGVYSCTPHKIITTGQGGVLVTDNEMLFKKLGKLKDFHRTAPGRDEHDGIGFNFKFTDLQAVIGIEQMKLIEFRITSKKKMYQHYHHQLSSIKGIELFETKLDEVTPWFIDILLPNQKIRDNFILFLKDKGVSARTFYPPINYQNPYSEFLPGSFPVSESIAVRGVWLPSSIGIGKDQIDYVCGHIKNFMENESI